MDEKKSMDISRVVVIRSGILEGVARVITLKHIQGCCPSLGTEARVWSQEMNLQIV